MEISRWFTCFTCEAVPLVTAKKNGWMYKRKEKSVKSGRKKRSAEKAELLCYLNQKGLLSHSEHERVLRLRLELEESLVQSVGL